MSERKVITTRVASNHPLPAYGGVQHPDELLERLAEATRTGAIPLVINHDHAQSLHARCLRAEVVDLPDGYKAVEADYEVDGDVWDAFQDELRAQGVRGGMSFTYAEYFSELTPRDKGRSGQLSLVADAFHFRDEDIERAGEALTQVGSVKIGRLYQFNAAPICRVVVEYVQQSGGLDAAVKDIMIGVAGSAIYDAIKRLLRGRSTTTTATESAPQLEIHVTTESDGASRQRLLLRTDNEEVIEHALNKFADGINRPEDILEWSETLQDWTKP